MASTKQPSTASTARRKSSKASLIIVLKLSSKELAKSGPASLIKEESPIKDASSMTPLPVPATLNGENLVGSASNTPAATGTPAPSSMPPPTEVVKKKGGKRSSAVALLPDGVPKVRGKPGPKKKARLEDGSIDHSSTVPRSTTTGAHKLGPKANQGAINAGLRALDRSGKPCRKWQRGSFKLKSFTGVVWEIPRWKAPPRAKVEPSSEASASGDSSKENKATSQIESEKSNSAADVERASAASQNISSPPSAEPTESTTAAPVVLTASA